MLDAGGGTGGVAAAICDKFPQIRATVADLPKVVKMAEQLIAENGLSDRIDASAADLCLEPPSGTYDVAIVRAVVQTLSKGQSQETLINVGRSMSSGGRIFIFGNVLENSRLAPIAPVSNNLAFLNLYDAGGAYTEKEFHEMLSNADFTNISIEHDKMDDGMGMVMALKQ